MNSKEFAQIAQVHFKDDFVGTTPSREKELQAILSFYHERHSLCPPKIDNIQFLFSSEEVLTLKCQLFNPLTVII